MLKIMKQAKNLAVGSLILCVVYDGPDVTLLYI